jgi:hypothetical protein
VHGLPHLATLLDLGRVLPVAARHAPRVARGGPSARQPPALTRR